MENKTSYVKFKSEGGSININNFLIKIIYFDFFNESAAYLFVVVGRNA